MPGCSTPDGISPGQRRGGELLPSTCWPCCFFNASQEAVGCLGCEHTSMINPKSVSVMLLSVSSPSLYSCLGLSGTRCSILHLDLLNLMTSLVIQFLKFVQVLQDSIPSFCCVKCTSWLHVICKLAESSFDLTVVNDEDIKEHQSQKP